MVQQRLQRDRVRWYRLRLSRPIAAGLVGMGLVGCAQALAPLQHRSAPALPAAGDPMKQPVAQQTQSSPPPAPPSASPLYQKALDRADSARSIGKSAANTDDWKLAVSRWQQAIKLIQEVPKTDVNHKYVKQQLADFQQGLAVAQQRSQGRQVQGQLKPAIFADKRLVDVEAVVPSGGNTRSFQAPIKYRRDRIPVIDVTFNGGRQFEMMVDTGASGTMITQTIADAIGIEEAGQAAIMTPAGRASTGYGFVGQISVGGKSIYDVPVTIGPVGLLGQDFFGDCEVSFRKTVIEFANCSV